MKNMAKVSVNILNWRQSAKFIFIDGYDLNLHTCQGKIFNGALVFDVFCFLLFAIGILCLRQNLRVLLYLLMCEKN